MRFLDHEAVQLLETIHHHVRQTVIGHWFERGYMPPTWAELQAPK
jgi:hypothetical protein